MYPENLNPSSSGDRGGMDPMPRVFVPTVPQHDVRPLDLVARAGSCVRAFRPSPAAALPPWRTGPGFLTLRRARSLPAHAPPGHSLSRTHCVFHAVFSSWRFPFGAELCPVSGAERFLLQPSYPGVCVSE